jgi:maleylpyruvate isomerase
MTELDRATDRLLHTVASLDEAAVAGPSSLPGWSRGHVLAHLARNADSYVNLLTAAATGRHIPQYASAAARDADIAAGANRPLAVHLDDLRASAAGFVDAAAAMPPQAWAAVVQASRGPRVAATLVWGRLREVEVHHVDLDAGYRTTDWPEAFSHRLLHEVVADLGGRSDAPAIVLHPVEAGHELTVGSSGTPTVTGPAGELAAWLTGRSPGNGLTVSPDGTLPTPPSWM